MTSEQLKQLLQTAIDAAAAASTGLLKHFGTTIDVERKQDGSPVTSADREAETTIREHLLAHASLGPLDILGEEQGLSGLGTRWRWSVDPIDGTRSFIRGIPLFGTLIALQDMDNKQPALGVIHLPVLGLTYAGAKGQGATCNGRRIHLPEAIPMDDAIIGVGDIAQFSAAKCDEDYRQLSAMHSYVRGYTDCFGHGLVISGAVGAMLDPALNPWDVLPTQLLIEEAGGTCRLRPSRAAGKVDCLFGNRTLVRHIARELSF